MSSFFDDTMQGVLEAIEIEKGNILLKKRESMPVPTYYVSEEDETLIDKLVSIRKNENISQAELVNKTGSSQQAISRFEQKTHSPSLKLFVSITEALGYDIQFIKKQ
jgi:DNA-binding XRE family transcriptional regulator